MQTIRRHLPTVAAVIALAAMVSGCLISGQEVVSVDAGDFLGLSVTTFESAEVNLDDNETYNDHKDDISKIDRVGFTATIRNTGGAALVSGWFSRDPYTSRAQVEAGATPLFLDYPTAAGPDHTITWTESQKILMNADALRDMVKEGGVIWFYATADSPSATVDVVDLVLIALLTVGL